MSEGGGVQTPAAVIDAATSMAPPPNAAAAGTVPVPVAAITPAPTNPADDGPAGDGGGEAGEAGKPVGAGAGTGAAADPPKATTAEIAAAMLEDGLCPSCTLRFLSHR